MKGDRYLCADVSVKTGCVSHSTGFPGGSEVNNLPAMQEPQKMRVQSLGREGPLEEDMASHSSILTWRIPWAEEPGGPESIGLQRVRHN